MVNADVDRDRADPLDAPPRRVRFGLRARIAAVDRHGVGISCAPCCTTYIRNRHCTRVRSTRLRDRRRDRRPTTRRVHVLGRDRFSTVSANAAGATRPNTMGKSSMRWQRAAGALVRPIRRVLPARASAHSSLASSNSARAASRCERRSVTGAVVAASNSARARAGTSSSTSNNGESEKLMALPFSAATGSRPR